MNHSLFLAAVGLTAFSGVPGLFISRRSMAGQFISIILFCAGSFAGLVGVFFTFIQGTSDVWALSIGVCGGKISFLIDPLASIFLTSIFLICAVGSIYGLEYWRQTDHSENGRKLRFFYGFLTAGMALVVVANDSLFFLFSWETMALSAFFLVGTEDEKKETRQASWIYFVATHFSILFLFAFFALLYDVRGSFEIFPFKEGEISLQTGNVLFLLALVAFGIKAGLFPLHVWLPSAHANAPSHVSAILSGVLLKIGVYGLMRICWLFPNSPAWWGTLLIVMGIISSVLGVAFAIGQHDLKRLLAYHSVENIGIIFLGLGLALLGRAEGKPEWVLLGMGGALLHVWNHGLFKSMLFLTAGSVVHSIHTREIDEMGGLGKRMPQTAILFLIGAVAICGLPPLNGFVSEFFIFFGFFKSMGTPGTMNPWGPLMAVPALALTGGLALACFTKVYGIIFLGSPRTSKAAEAKEGGAVLLFPVFFLGIICFGIGLLPWLLVPLLESASKSWGPLLLSQSRPLLELVPFGVFTIIGFSLLLLFFLGNRWLNRQTKHRKATSPVLTWDCGYIQPAPSMQYSASSYAQILVDFFKWVLFPQKSLIQIKAYFPRMIPFHSHVPETVLDWVLLPLVKGVQWTFKWSRYLQTGYLQAYVFYIGLTFLFFILWR